MRATSSFVSISLHAALALAVLHGTTKARPGIVIVSSPPPLVFPPSEGERSGGNPPLPGPLAPVDVQVPPIDAPVIVTPSRASDRTFSPAPGGDTATGKSGGGWVSMLEAPPQALAGPLPRYPDLLRQAGIEGRVVFEAIVDTTGRIEPGSLILLFATHPAFVPSARQALLATLFRPAFVGGRAVPVRVRLPIEFILKNGAARRP